MSRRCERGGVADSTYLVCGPTPWFRLQTRYHDWGETASDRGEAASEICSSVAMYGTQRSETGMKGSYRSIGASQRRLAAAESYRSRERLRNVSPRTNPNRPANLARTAPRRRRSVRGATRYPASCRAPIRSASSLCVRPRGLRNSSRSISPACVGARCVGMRTMQAPSGNPRCRRQPARHRPKRNKVGTDH